MKAKIIFPKLDLLIQTLIILPTYLSVPFMLFDTSSIFLYLFGLFFLGVWQLCSAFIRWLAFGKKNFGYYLGLALTYLCSLATATFLVKDWGFAPSFLMKPMAFGLGLILPGIAGLYYYFWCWRIPKELNENTQFV